MQEEIIKMELYAVTVGLKLFLSIEDWKDPVFFEKHDGVMVFAVEADIR